MSEHGTWLDFLAAKIPALEGLSHSLQGSMERTWKWQMFQGTHWTINHVIFAVLVMLFIAYGAMKFRSAVSQKGLKGLVPPKGVGMRNLFESLTDVTFGLMVTVMGEKEAKRFLPLIGSLALFILFSNIMALIPMFGVPTTTLKTNLVLAGIVFFVTHYAGIKEHGGSYIKQFLGPLWYLAPLMLIIEIFSHIARPVSLALRLMGNMAADHKVVFAFFSLVPFLVPVPFLILGVLVCIVQTVVFCLLSMVYISMAVSHDH